jgi:hypothetical protein
MHRKVAAAVAAALALGIVGCGGSEETLSRAELVKRVELACREGQRAGQRQTRAAGNAGDRAAFVNAIVASQKVVVERIDDLSGSGAAKADFDSFKEAVRARLEGIEQIAAADPADQQRVVREHQTEIEGATRRAVEAARRLGIVGCI